MRRRKLLIGIGAAATGGTAAFGTEAFTSVQAERNVDVNVAGDASSFLALQPTSSENAVKYVDTESSDSTIEINLDGGSQDGGSGVPQDGITKLDDLFSVLNRGSQPVNVYFEDDSDAVTFRSDGSAIEGAGNSVEVGVGEEIVVSLTVDTLNNDVNTDSTLIDTATIFAQANDPSPGGEAPVAEFNRIVNSGQVSSGSSEGRYYADLRTALDEATAGDNIGLEESITLSDGSGKLALDTDDITLASVDPSSPQTITAGDSSSPASSAPNGPGPAIELSADGVSLQSVDVDVAYNNTQFSGGAEILVSGDNARVSDITAERTYGENNGTPGVFVSGSEVTVANNNFGTSSNGSGPIAFGSGGVEIVDNVIRNTTEEGIWCFGSDVAESDVTIRGNQITNIDTNRGSDDKAVVQPHIKLVTTPATVNGQSNVDGQFKALLTENNNTGDGEEFRVAIGNDPIDTKQNIGVIVDSSDPDEAYADIPTGISEAGEGGYVLVRDGTYTSAPVAVDQPGVTIAAAESADPTVDASGAESGFDVEVDGVTIRGLTVADAGKGVSSGEVEGIFIGNPNGFTDKDSEITIDDVDINKVDGTSKSTEGIHIKHYDAGDPIDGVNITDVSINGVDSGGAGGNGIKLQADINNIDVTDTTIENITGAWGYGVVLTPSSNESGSPGSVSLVDTTIDGVDPRTFDGTGVGIDSASGDPEPATSGDKIADPNELSFTDVVIQNVDIGILERNTNKEFSEPDAVKFSSIRGQEIYDPSS